MTQLIILIKIKIMKIKINTNKLLKIMSILTFIGVVGSCDKDDDSKIWDDSAAAVISKISSTDIMEGDEITITGKYFSSKAENSVSLNGLDATIIGANISNITAIVPEGAVSGNLTVTSDGKVSNSLPYTIIQPIIPTITSIDPTGGKIGSTVTITGTNFSTTLSENEVRFNGIAAEVSESTTTTITTTVPAGATTGNVTVIRDRESNGIMYTVTESKTLTIQIIESWDDVEEGAINGAMANESSDLELGEYDTWTQDDVEQGVQTIGLRFPALDLPASSTILSANIQFTTDKEGADPAEMTIYGENAGNALAFTEDFYNVTSRTKTTENAVWEIPEWIAEGDAGLAQQTPDLISIVQAIVNREDWSPGNSMVFILAPSGSTVDETSSSGGREAEAADGSSSGTLAPVLTIIYEE